MGAVGRRHDPTSNGLTACRMRLHLASAAPGLRPSATPARRPHLRLPGTTGLRFALHGRQRECDSESLCVVFMSQILEHALDVNLWIKKSRDFLVDDGILAIALPNYGSIFRMIMQENEPYIYPPAHLNFFNPDSLSRLLENHGFKVEAIQWISRIPKRTFEKRLPRLGKPLVPVINVASSASLKIIDALRLGMMINVYGRKVNA